MSDKYTDVSFMHVPDDEDCTISGAEIARRIGLKEPQTLYEWAKAFSSFLSIKKVNGRWKFSQKSLEEFAFIKELRDKNWTWKQIREHLNKRGFSFAEYDSGLINPNDPMGYEALAIQISMKNELMLQNFLVSLEQALDKRDAKLLEKIDERILNGVSDEIEFHMLNVKSNIKNQTKEILEQKMTKIKNDIEEIKKETLISIANEFSNNSKDFNNLTEQIKEMKEVHQKDIEMIQKLRKDLEEKKENQEQNQKTDLSNQSIISKIKNMFSNFTHS